MQANQKGEVNRNLIIGIIAVLVIGVLAAFLLMGGDDAEAPETTEPVTSQGDAVPPLPDDTPAPEDEEDNPDGVTSTYTVDSFNFGYSLDRIEAAPGETVTINLTNSGGSHDFVIDELGVATAIIGAGDTDSVTFTIPEDAAGQEYEFYCSVGNHRELGMVGDLIVSEL